jgi:hypothetical protein
VSNPAADFVLNYELRPDDLLDVVRAGSNRQRRRVRSVYNAAGWALIGAILTAITIILDLPSVVKDSSGAPGLMYLGDAVIWAVVLYYARIAWRLNPKRLVRRVWRVQVGLDGRHRDEVGAEGITSIAPNGTLVFKPWATFTRFRETDDAFLLVNQHERVDISLPKRGLPSPDLISSLREYLDRSVGRPPAGSMDPAGTSGSEP